MTLWLVDNSLKNSAGHPLEYARTVAQECASREIDVHVLAHCSCPPDLAPDLDIRPAIRQGYFERYNSSGMLLRLGRLGIAADFVRSNDEFYRDLHISLSPSIRAGDTVFAPSVDHRQLLGWTRWMRSLPKMIRPKLVLMMRYNFRDGLDHNINTARKMVVRGLSAIAKLMAAGYPVRMATDSARLAQEYQEYAGIKFEVFPIPHTQNAVRLDVREHDPSAPVRFVALGDARVEKGYDLLAAAIRILATFAKDGTAGMEFALQCPVTHEMNQAGRAELDELKSMDLPNVELIDKILSREEYSALLASADVVALPYRKQQYYARTSGPLAESLAAAKPVIVTRDTWLSDQLDTHGAGYSIRDQDIVGLAQALQNCRDNIAELSAKATERQAGWVGFHNPKRFVDMLISSE